MLKNLSDPALILLLTTLLGITAFFMVRWIKGVEQRSTDVVLKTDNTLERLNTTLTKVNLNLEVYQAANTVTINHFKGIFDEHKKKIYDLETEIDELKVQYGILSRKGKNENTTG
jgi:hypothetical protein